MAIDFSSIGGTQVSPASSPSSPASSIDFSSVGGTRIDQQQPESKSLLRKALETVAIPDEAAGEAVRVAAQGYPFRLPSIMKNSGIENQYLTTKQPPASFLGELTGSVSALPVGTIAAVKGQPIGPAMEKEVFRPKNQGAGDIASQVGASFMAPEVANAPLNAAIKGVGSLASGTGKLAAQISSIGTKVDAKDYQTIFQHPEGMTPGALQKASDNFGKALTDSGIDPNKISSERLRSLKNSESYAFDKFKELQDSNTLSPEKALFARQAVDKIYPIPNQKNGSYRNLLDKMKDAFNNVLNNSTPQIQTASKQYAIAKAGDKFMSLLPMTQAGKPAFFHGVGMEEIIRRALMSGKPEDALGVLPMIPAVAGATTAAAGLASRPLSYIANNPFLKSALLSALATNRSNQNQTGQ